MLCPFGKFFQTQLIRRGLYGFPAVVERVVRKWGLNLSKQPVGIERRAFAGGQEKQTCRTQGYSLKGGQG